MIEKMDKDEVLNKIGLKIRELREEKKLSIQELSDELNIEYNNLIRIEKGRTNLTIGTLLKICLALNVKLIDIVNIE
jgi:transcriptional regulator with XRE-family HTH domain